MNQKQIKIRAFSLSHPVERIRGGSILLQLGVSWEVWDDDQHCTLVDIPGVALVSDTLTPEALDEATQEALEFSRMQLTKVLSRASSLIQGDNAPAVLRTLLTRRQEEVKTHLSATVPVKTLDTESTDTQQQQMNRVCDTLGIQRIPLAGTTILEAAAMINELQFVAKNMIKVGD